MRPNSFTSLTPFRSIFCRHLIVPIHILSGGNRWLVHNQRIGGYQWSAVNLELAIAEKCESSWAWLSKNLFSIMKLVGSIALFANLRPFAIMRVRRHTCYMASASAQWRLLCNLRDIIRNNEINEAIVFYCDWFLPLMRMRWLARVRWSFFDGGAKCWMVMYSFCMIMAGIVSHTETGLDDL